MSAINCGDCEKDGVFHQYAHEATSPRICDTSGYWTPEEAVGQSKITVCVCVCVCVCLCVSVSVSECLCIHVSKRRMSIYIDFLPTKNIIGFQDRGLLLVATEEMLLFLNTPSYNLCEYEPN